MIRSLKFNRFYDYQARRCSELQELKSLGDHNQQVKNIFNNLKAHLTGNEEGDDIYSTLSSLYP
ncbi:MAG: hypothetical protein K0M45_07895 [Candidatus Paracaedibacteraceae bacterium]|nr:hypothetical protein [Candidatus Paracaedibacteraceae bacterium]